MAANATAQLVGSDTEESSSLSLELIVDKTKEDARARIEEERTAFDYDPEMMKDKPWLRPGANIADYFNYGFTEQTWKKYCELQRQNREWAAKQMDSERDGAGEGAQMKSRGQDDRRRQYGDNSKRRRMDEERGHGRGGRRYY